MDSWDGKLTGTETYEGLCFAWNSIPPRWFEFMRLVKVPRVVLYKNQNLWETTQRLRLLTNTREVNIDLMQKDRVTNVRHQLISKASVFIPSFLWPLELFGYPPLQWGLGFSRLCRHPLLGKIDRRMLRNGELECRLTGAEVETHGVTLRLPRKPQEPCLI